MRIGVTVMLVTVLAAPVLAESTSTVARAGAPRFGLGQLEIESGPTPTIVEIRVHGNHTTPDEEVLRLAGVSAGQAFSETLLAEVTGRLQASGRFREVEVRKRYASLTDPRVVMLVIVVEERAGVSMDVPSPGPLRRLRASTMWMPVLAFEDGYGFTYGMRFSLVDLLGTGTRVSTPLTWGADRRAALEVTRTFARGPVTRLEAAGGIVRRENPAFDVGDRRDYVGLRAERALSTNLRIGATARWAKVRFGDVEDDMAAAGADAIVDTRQDPTFPRNAVYAELGWEHLWFDTNAHTDRVRADLRGYIGLVGQSVLVLRARQDRAAGSLPAFEQALLGGAASLRGARLGFRAGDRLAAGSVEIRMPLSSPMRVGRMGIAAFVDSGAVYDAESALDDARFHTGVGGGVFLSAAVFSLRVDVARRLGGGTQGHFTLGLTF